MFSPSRRFPLKRIKYTYGLPADTDTQALSEILAWAFGAGVPADMTLWLDKIGRDNIRVLRERKRVVAQLGIVWMGQFFGGRSVPMAGIAAVGTVPERRGHGAGAELMRGALRDIREAGYPLSALYPATQPIYRSVGYEQAGGRYEIRVPAGAIDVKDRELAVEPVNLTDAAVRADIEAAYRMRSAACTGNLDRGPYIWNRIFAPKGTPPYAYRVVGTGTEGYVFMTKLPRESVWADFPLLDIAARTPRAARRLLSLMADHKSLANEFVWYGSPADPLLAHLREQPASVKLKLNWMVRIVDVKEALVRRGWPLGLSGELQFAVTEDPVFPENEGKWTLTVADGEAEVKRGGNGALKTDINGLAMLYSGYLPAREAVIAGFCEGPELELETAGALFAGPAPFMPDMF